MIVKLESADGLVKFVEIPEGCDHYRTAIMPTLNAFYIANDSDPYINDTIISRTYRYEGHFDIDLDGNIVRTFREVV